MENQITSQPLPFEIVVLGENTIIGRNCTIRDSILWDGVTIKDNLAIERCIVGNGVLVEHSLKNEIVV